MSNDISVEIEISVNRIQTKKKEKNQNFRSYLLALIMFYCYTFHIWAKAFSSPVYTMRYGV